MKRMGLLAVLALGLAACGPPPPSTGSGPLAAPARARAAEVQSALRNAAVAEETYRVENGTYTTSLEDLQTASGLNVSPEITLMVHFASAHECCLMATHGRIPVAEQWQTATLDGPNNPPSPADGCS